MRLDSAGSGTRLLGVLQALYAGNPVVLGQLRAAGDAIQPHHTDRDVIELLNRDIFTAMDRAADARIQRAAIRAVAGVAGCPHPALDALVVVAVAVALVRDLMTIYGLRHSARSLWRVLTHSRVTASSTAVMSTMVDLAMRAAHDLRGVVELDRQACERPEGTPGHRLISLPAALVGDEDIAQFEPGAALRRRLRASEAARRLPERRSGRVTCTR